MKFAGNQRSIPQTFGSLSRRLGVLAVYFVLVNLWTLPAMAEERSVDPAPLSFGADIQEAARANGNWSRTRPVNGSLSEIGGRVFRFLRGKPVADGILILPIGVHTGDPLTGASTTDFNYVSVSYESFSFGTFVNSFGDRTWVLTHGRNIYEGKRLGVDLFAGLMVGYHGKLAQSDVIPGFLKPVFEGNLNPVAGISPYYRLNDDLQLRLLLAGRSLLFGVKYNF